jgi:glycerol kinase
VLARSVDSTGGVHFVPALSGLGSPWWDADARGLVTGLTRGTTRAHLARAALEAIAHQVADVVDALPDRPTVLRADGGATENSFLMQVQAARLRLPVEAAVERETTALGAAALAAGRGAAWPLNGSEPQLAAAEVADERADWGGAVSCARSYPDR